MATSESDEVEALLSMATEVVPGPSASLQLASLANLEGNIVTEVSMSELKPIVMTMANMANIENMAGNMANMVEEHNIVPAANVPEPDNDIQISDQSETVLASHLLSSLPTRHRISKIIPQSTEVYRDSTTGVTYEIQRGATRRGGDKLIDSLGFTYNLKVGKSKNKNISYWWCAVRNQQLRCPASVTQKGNTFVRGKNKHEHLVGQCTPKNPVNKPVKNPVLKMGRPAGSIKTTFPDASNHSKDFKIIKNGSKAGMDLLKDCLGFTYTLKKVMGGGLKSYWCCSVRNRHLRCPASVIQYGQNNFMVGKYSHKHLPHQNTPAAIYEVVPSLKDFKNHKSQISDESDLEDREDDYKDRSYTRKKASNGSVYIHSGKVVTTTSSRVKLSMGREKKRRDHPTFLGPRCTINLTKCDDHECNCRQVHCPFCDKHHFKPTKAGRVQDHLELTHFAHGVQYDDLMIVKCFQDCDLEKTFGHYHCVFCFRQMLKRTAYARHMLRHMTKMGIPDRLLVLPDSKFPDIINAYGYEIPICKNTSCGPPSQEKHYHCPNCSQMCRERSLTVNHLWRCLQKKRDGVNEPDDTEDEIMGVVDEDQLLLHYSHIKSFKDIPVEKCVSIDCCHQKYHCRLCPKNVFLPTYRQHLIAHYVSHWKQRVLYKNLSILKCFHPCDGIDRSMCKTRYHYHCPICAKIILTKGTFEEHLKSCHMFRFGENLIQNVRVAQESAMENDLMLTQESAPLNENVEFMEDQLTSEAAMRHERRKLSREMFKRRKQKVAKKQKGKKPKKKKYEAPPSPSSSSSENYSEEEEDEEEEEEKIVENDVYELCSAVISPKIAKKVRSTSQLKSLLGGVAGATRVKLSLSKSGQYRLTGPAEELLTAQRMLTKKINKNMSDDEEDSSPKKKGKGKASAKKKGKVASPKKLEVKKGRGRPRKENVYNDDSFPYSEIKEIIEASKDTKSKTKRGRGRPAVKVEQKPDGTLKETVTVRVVENTSKNDSNTSRSERFKGRSVQVEYSESAPSTPRTPGRYGTRGVRKDYVELSSGGVRIKQEPLSDGEDNFEQEVSSKSYASNRNRGRVRKITDDFEEPEVQIKKTAKSKVGRGRGRPRKKVETSDDQMDDVEEVEDSAELTENIEDDHLDQDMIKQEDGEMEEEPEEEDMDDSLSLYDDSDEELPAPEDEENDDDNDETQDMNADHNYITIDGKSKDLAGDIGGNLDAENIDDENGDTQGTQVPPVHKIGMRKSNLPTANMMADGTQVNREVAPDYKCSLCDDYLAESFSDLTDHLKTVHHVYEPPRCDICEKDFDTTQTLKSHIDRRHGPEKLKYPCDYTDCDREFVSESGKYGHMNKVHLNIENHKDKKYDCDKCDYKSNSMDDMSEHNKVIHDGILQCKICDKIFMTYQSLKSHNKFTHSGQSVSCNICNKTFNHESYLNKHMKSHSSEDFTCLICDKKLKSKTSLKMHLDTHVDTSERSYKFVCSYCGKKFALKSNLKDHMNKHTGAKPYKCDLCEKSFGFRSMLMKHKTFVHSSERPYKCDVCQKGFKFMNLLRNHMTTHTNSSRHVCTQCNKTFSTASTLKFHGRKCRGVSWKQNLILPHPPGTLFVFTEPGTSSNQAVEVQQDAGIQYATPTGIQYATPPQGNQPIIQFPDLGAIETTGITGEIEIVNDESGMIDNVVMEEQTVSESLPAAETAPTETEVYACSECQATFGTYKDAENHVLTAHSVMPTPEEGIDLETENIVLG